MKRTRWIVRTKYTRRDGKVLYWGTEGWGDMAAARIYSPVETRLHPLPFGGTWQEVEFADPGAGAAPSLHLVPDASGLA